MGTVDVVVTFTFLFATRNGHPMIAYAEVTAAIKVDGTRMM